MRNKSYLIIALLLIIANMVLMQFPIGRLIIYPFVILSTWFHEMGHGITSLILGGSFSKIEIFPDGSGIAYISSSNNFGRLGSALVAMMGPLFPPILGYIYLASSKKANLAKLFMFMTSIFLAISTIIWVRTSFGFFFLLLLSLLIFFISISNNEKLIFFCAQIIGIQAFMSVYLSLGYLFSSTGNINQSSLTSDTAVISQNLFLPNWFWASAILIISVTLLLLSLRSLSIKAKQSHQ